MWDYCGSPIPGIRVTELALLEVADVLYPSGAIKPEVCLRANTLEAVRCREQAAVFLRCTLMPLSLLLDRKRPAMPTTAAVDQPHPSDEV